MAKIIEFNFNRKKKEVCMDSLMIDRLTKERMLEIEGVVAEALEDVDFSDTPYVDIVSMVKRDGFTVKPQEMELNTTGCLFVNDSDDENRIRLILVNTSFKNPDKEDDVVFKKSRFITAHEYGHFVLHKAINAHRDTYHRTEEIEVEADYFARSILMPLEYFKSCYKILNDFSSQDEDYVIEMLSKFFKVTKNKVKKRINDLSILNS